MKKILYLSIIVFLVYGCGSEKGAKSTVNDGVKKSGGRKVDSSMIPAPEYPGPEPAFIVEDESRVTFSIPDSLEYMTKGKGIMYFNLDSGGNIRGLTVNSLKIYDNNGNRIVNFTSSNRQSISYPDSIMSYISWIKERARGVRFRRNEDTSISDSNRVPVMFIIE